MAMTRADYTAAASRLCLACGMCCNGVLFHIVRLQPADSVKHLEAQGLKVKRKKREPYFNQPCPFLHSCTCGIYEMRPIRCRAFECRQLKRLENDETTEADAMLAIEEVKRRVANVEALLQHCGNTSTTVALAERYAQVLLDAEADESKPVHPQLASEMQSLNKLLNEEFRLAGS
jgi:hypothetical protein